MLEDIIIQIIALFLAIYIIYYCSKDAKYNNKTENFVFPPIKNKSVNGFVVIGGLLT